MDTLWLDLRYALRSLLRSPGFALVAALTLALGIGANTAIFSVVYSVLLRPLAYTEPEQLVSIRAGFAGTGATDVPASQPEYQDYLREVSALQALAAIYPININFTGLGEPQRIQAAVVSDNYFRLLGVKPALGRDFTKDDDGGRIGYVTIISYDLWRQRFGGDPGIIGKTVRLDDDPMTVVGVMPRGFRHALESGASPMEVWAPISLEQSRHELLQCARRPGVRPHRAAPAGEERRGRQVGDRGPPRAAGRAVSEELSRWTGVAAGRGAPGGTGGR